MVHDRLAERALLRESAERFVSRSYDIEGRNALAQGTPGFSTAHWATFAELGWLMIRIPEELGGIGAPFADAAVLLEAFGAGLLLEPFTSTVLLSGALLAEGGASPVAAALLEALGEGGARVATAYRERGDAGDVRAPATHITVHGDELTLDGTKIAVPFAASADAFIVSARDEGGALALVVAMRDRPGVSVVEDVALDGSRSASVTFCDVRVARAARLPLEDAAAALERALDQARRRAVRRSRRCDVARVRRCSRPRAGTPAVRTADRHLPNRAPSHRRHVRGVRARARSSSSCG